MVVSRQSIADFLLVACIAGGLFFAPILLGIPVAMVLRDRWWQPDWRNYHWALVLAVAWAISAVLLRGETLSKGLMLYYGYIWLFPMYVAFYKPDLLTIRSFCVLAFFLFALDFLFNVYSLVSGADLLGRTLDARQGFAVGRGGGLFGHSFYSGSISIAVLTLALAGEAGRARGVAIGVLAILNMVAAGSWRLPMAGAILVGLSACWKSMSRTAFLIAIVVASLLTIVGVVATSGLFGTSVDESLSNTFRLFAWNLALEKIVQSPLLGVGVPDMSQVNGVSFESIDEFLIAESWYLSSSLAFGVPYTILFLAVLAGSLFGRNFEWRSKTLALVVPLILIDLTAGEFFSGIFIYSWVWLEIGRTSGLVGVPRNLGRVPGGFCSAGGAGETANEVVP